MCPWSRTASVTYVTDHVQQVSPVSLQRPALRQTPDVHRQDTNTTRDMEGGWWRTWREREAERERGGEREGERGGESEREGERVRERGGRERERGRSGIAKYRSLASRMRVIT